MRSAHCVRQGKDPNQIDQVRADTRGAALGLLFEEVVAGGAASHNEEIQTQIAEQLTALWTILTSVNYELQARDTSYQDMLLQQPVHPPVEGVV